MVFTLIIVVCQFMYSVQVIEAVGVFKLNDKYIVVGKSHYNITRTENVITYNFN